MARAHRLVTERTRIILTGVALDVAHRIKAGALHSKISMLWSGRPRVDETGSAPPVDIVVAWHGRVRIED